MKLILRILLSAIAVIILANILPNVSVDSFMTAVIVAVVLSLLNVLVKPILVILTLPVTIVTLGLFLLSSILWHKVFYADKSSITVVAPFFFTDLLLSFLQSIFFSLLKEDES